MLLTDKERDSELWRKVAIHLGEVLDKAQRDIEKTTNSEIDTAILRGRIKLTRQLLKLGDCQSPSAAQTDNEYR